jgi:drug/metabolite transporter (DMT)-like permease
VEALRSDNINPHPISPDASLRWKIVAAFTAVYLIWGSTYLAMRFAVETLPPFLMAGSRFLLAGAILYAWARARGEAKPKRLHWIAATVVGGLLLVSGNGGVAWAEQYIPSGLAALLISITPVWMVLLDWARPGGVRPNGGVSLGLILGLVGVAVLIGPVHLSASNHLYFLGAAAAVFATLSWSAGSVYSRHAALPSAPLLATGMEMLCGGALLVALGLLTGEAGNLHLDAVTARSFLSFLYLVVFGSLIGFTSFRWLLGVAPISRVSTYAYVNPVVAVVVGWAFAHEALSPRTLVAAATIVLGVVLITTYRPVETRQGEPT